MKSCLCCGLCDCKVKEKSWEEHIQSKEHQFRLEKFLEEAQRRREQYGSVLDLKGIVDLIRKNVNTPEKVHWT